MKLKIKSPKNSSTFLFVNPSDISSEEVKEGSSRPTVSTVSASFVSSTLSAFLVSQATNNKTNNEQRFSSQFIENGSFIKLRNMELGYTFPDKIAKKMYMSNLRVYVSGENLLTMKKTWGKDAFTSIDPEDRDYGYLRPITVNFGINATF